MNTIFVPSNGPDDWRIFLGDPVKHWRTGYSAKALAHCWEEAYGFPTSIKDLVTSLSDPDLTNIQPLLAIPEHKVPLPGGGNPSQNDVFVLARSDTALISICVEGKVNESFDKTLAEWGPDSTPGKRSRLDYLADLLGLTGQDIGHLRYQLLHRIASAIIEAKRFHAPIAMMLVHSFSQEHLWFEDYAAFVVALCGKTPAIGQLVDAGSKSGFRLFLGWAVGEEKYLGV